MILIDDKDKPEMKNYSIIDHDNESEETMMEGGS
jgi:hypothetical protein